MKKLLLLASVALLAACSESDLNQAEVQQQKESSGAVLFDVYAQRGLTRGGGQLGDLNNKNIGKNGFGVFGYYTDGDVFGPGSKPNFMYNQQVVMADPSKEATLGSTPWIYEPVKYWPNEFGSAAISDGVDRVSFFAYAPWTLVEPTTGKIVVPDSIKSADSISVWQNKNIVSINKNSDLGDPIVKYRVDTDPATSVDLLWGVAAPSANEAYGAIDGPNGSSKQNADVKINVGEPFLNLVKPNNPADDKLTFNLKHALAKVKFTIDYIDDAETPAGEAAGMIDLTQTRIYVREFKISGWATEGALNLNNQEMPGQPNWIAFDGKSDLEFGDELTFFDGRKDDYEGKKAGEAKTEKPQGLNPNIIENYDATETIKTFGTEKTPGVAAMTKEVKAEPEPVDFERTTTGQQAFSGTQLLFGGNPDVNGGFFYIIPRNSNNEGVNVEISYDVETIDTLLASTISDGLNHGVSVANVIRKTNIFGDGIDFKAGYQYVVNLHLGMTSVKIDADVQPWIDTDTVKVDLPDNQDPSGEDGRAGILPPKDTEVGLVHTYVVTPATATTEAVTKTINVTFKSDGTFKGSYMAGTITAAEGTADADLEAAGISTSTKYYIPATAKEGDVFELLTFAGEEATNTGDGGSRRMDEEAAETPENLNLLATGIYVKVGSVTPGEGGGSSATTISITLNKESLNLTKGSSEKLTATVSPEDATVTWSSSDDEVATVDQEGNVTATGKGIATITATATAKDGTETATCSVNVGVNTWTVTTKFENQVGTDISSLIPENTETGAGEYEEGSDVTLTAPDLTGKGYDFQSWSKEITGIAQNEEVTATYQGLNIFGSRNATDAILTGTNGKTDATFNVTYTVNEGTEATTATATISRSNNNSGSITISNVFNNADMSNCKVGATVEVDVRTRVNGRWVTTTYHITINYKQ